MFLLTWTEQHGNTAPFVRAWDISSVCLSPRMPLLTLHSTNRLLLTLEVWGGYVKPGRFAGLGIYGLAPLALAGLTYTEHSQPPARLPRGAAHLCLWQQGSLEVSLSPQCHFNFRNLLFRGSSSESFSCSFCLLFLWNKVFHGVCVVPVESVCLSEVSKEEAGSGCGSAKSRKQIGSGSRCSFICLLQKASLGLVGCARCFGGGRGYWRGF